MENPNISLPYFVKMLPDGRMQLTLDNHLLQTFAACEKLFWYRHILRMRPKGPGGVALNIGAWWSAVLGGHDYKQGEETIHILGIYEHMQRGKFPALQEFISSAGLLWNVMGMDALKQSKPQAYNQFGGSGGAVRMAHEYYTRQALIDHANWRMVGSELPFGRLGEVPIYEDEKIVVRYMGKPDLVVFDQNILKPVEHKTVDRIKSNTHLHYKPHPQIAGYVYAIQQIAKQVGFDGIVDRCIVNVASRMPPAEKPRDGVKRPRFLRVYPNFSPAELEEWRRGVILKAKRIHHSLVNDEWIWKESNCHLYGGCEFRVVDSKPETSRKAVLVSDFVQVEPWTPYSDEEEEDSEVF